MTVFFRLCMLFILFVATPAQARPPKGFHTGPYLQLLLGAVDSTFDRNLVSNTTTGRDEELALGFMFGWHTSDHWGPFIEARYSTDNNGGNRIHMVNGNVGATYTLILDALTRFQSLRILPYIGGDLLFRIDALPADPTIGNNLINRYGVGPGIVGGINFLFKRYVYIGIMGQEDFPYFSASTPAYGSGWHPQWSASLNAGFHF